MTIRDETLSAFLDAELSETEMANIREQISADESLSDRLAELALVDHTLKMIYTSIDAEPLPAGISELLATHDGARAGDAKVVSMALWRRCRQGLRDHTGFAVAAALILGLFVGQFYAVSGAAKQGEQWTPVALALDTTASGHTQILPDASTLTPHATFISKDGEYCRVFQYAHADRADEQIACRPHNQPNLTQRDSSSSWHLIATLSLEVLPANMQLRTASGDSGGALLDSVVEHMLTGEILNASAEATVISEHWR